MVSFKKQVGSIAAVETFYFRFISVSDFKENENVCKLTIEISITPINNRQAVSLKTVVKKKISPTSAVQTQMVVQSSNGLIAGYELTGIPDGQPDLFGEVHEQKYVQLKEIREEENI